MKLFAAVLALVLVGCTKPEAEPEIRYLVAGHDAATDRWTIERINTLEKSRVRYVMKCEFYRWGTKEPVKDSDACDLVVGENVVPNPLPSRPDAYLDVFIIGSNTMVISKGVESDRVNEQFSIESAQVVPYGHGA